MAAIIALNLAKLTLLYCVPYVGALAVGAATPGFDRMQALSSLMLLLAGVLPSVSGLGSIEISFLFIFKKVLGSVSATSALVLYRIATYFFPFIVSIIVFMLCRKKLVPAKKSEVKE